MWTSRPNGAFLDRNAPHESLFLHRDSLPTMRLAGRQKLGRFPLPHLKRNTGKRLPVGAEPLLQRRQQLAGLTEEVQTGGFDGVVTIDEGHPLIVFGEAGFLDLTQGGAAFFHLGE